MYVTYVKRTVGVGRSVLKKYFSFAEVAAKVFLFFKDGFYSIIDVIAPCIDIDVRTNCFDITYQDTLR